MGLIKKAIAIGGIYYVYKKVNESKNGNQQCGNNQQNLPVAPPQQQPVTTTRAVGHQSYCNGQCDGKCSFNASEQYGYEAKAPMYDEKAAYGEKALA